MLGVVVVVYHNFDMTANFINKELPKLSVPMRVAIVNNASTVEQSEELAKACGGICITDNHLLQKGACYILHTKENLGYARGNNMGASFLSRHFDCDYLLFSNDDIIFKLDSHDLISKMVESFDTNPSIAAIGPRVIGTDNKDQSPHYKVISPYRQVAWRLFPFLRGRRKEKTNQKSISLPQNSYCYWVSGAFFMMKTDDFLAVNGFDPDTFLYAEEVILAERLKQINKQIYFLADVSVVHLGGSSTSNAMQNSKLKQILIESNSLYYRRYLQCNKLIIWLYKILNR